MTSTKNPWPARPQSPIVVPHGCAGEWMWFWEDARFVVPHLDLRQIKLNATIDEVFLEDVVSREHSTLINNLRLNYLPEWGPALSGRSTTGSIKWTTADTRIGTLTRPFTFSILIRVDGAAGTRWVMESGNLGLLQLTSRWEFRVGGSDTTHRVSIDNISLIEDTNWHQLIFVAADGDDRAYIDGVRSENSDTTSGDPGALDSALAVHASQSNGFRYKDDSAMLCILNTGVTDAQALQWARDPWGPLRMQANPFGRSLHILAAGAPPTRNRAMVCS